MLSILELSLSLKYDNINIIKKEANYKQIK